jgi:serine/threonine protein kinase
MASLSVGSVFGGEWRVLGRIAEGGMGTVYRVEQCSTGQLRALKVLRAGLWEDPRARERFELEAQVVSKIRSEHITKVIAAGIDPDEGAPWIAMELLEGETLKKRVEREGPYGRIETVELARQLCHALATAHDAGVVHRDLKPENIFIARSSRAEGGELVKLLDFGIATALEEFETSATVTSVIGSPLWMAPEQVRRERIKPATDVWSLGLLLFWVLTGKPYWKKTFPADAVLFEKMVEPLVPASQRAVELSCEGAIPPGFDPWFARCVSRKIDERYTDAEEAFDAFERIMTDPRMPRALPASRAKLAATVAATALAAASAAWFARPYIAPPQPSVELPPLRMTLGIGDGSTAISLTDARSEDASPRADAPAVRDASTPSSRAELLDASTASRPIIDASTASRPIIDASTASRPTIDASTASRLRIDAAPTDDARAPRQPSVGSVRVALAPNTPGAAPTLQGFTVRHYAQAHALCTARGATHPWQVIPDWYLERRNELRLDERARRLAAERSMLSRISDPALQQRAGESVTNQEQNLQRDRDMLEAEVLRSLGNLRSVLSSRARESRCSEAGLRADAAALYATWCCR